MQRGEWLSTKGYAFFVIAMSIFATDSLWFDLSVLLGLSYATWRFSPTRFLTGNRVKTDDLIVIIGFVLLSQQLFVGQFADIALITGLLAVIAFSFVVGAILPVKKTGALYPYKAVRWVEIIYAFIFTWGMHILLFRPIVTWLFVAPWLAAAIGVIILFIQKTPKYTLSLFHSKHGILLGLSGVLTLHYTMVFVQNIPLIASWMSFSWDTILAALGSICIIALPGYMWFTTYKVRKSHQHLPDWPVFVVSTVSALVVFALLRPIFTLAAGFHGVAIIPAMAGSGYALYAAIGTLLVFSIIGYTDDFLRRVLMMGPFFAGIFSLGIFAFFSFVSEFNIVTQPLPLSALPVTVLIFVGMAFFLALGYMSFLYELWRD